MGHYLTAAALALSVIAMVSGGVWAVGQIQAEVSALTVQVRSAQQMAKERTDAIYRILGRLEKRLDGE